MKSLALVFLIALLGCEEAAGRPKSAAEVDRERRAQEQEQMRRGVDEISRRTDERVRASEANAAALRASPVSSPPIPQATIDSASAQVFIDAERHIASCRADRPKRKAVHEAEAATERKFEDLRALVAFRVKNCKRDDRLISAPKRVQCEDEDGYLRMCDAMGVIEIIWVCPASGPPGARGTYSGGRVHVDQTLRTPDMSHVASPPPKDPAVARRDDECTDVDRADALAAENAKP